MCYSYTCRRKVRHEFLSWTYMVLVVSPCAKCRILYGIVFAEWPRTCFGMQSLISNVMIMFHAVLCSWVFMDSTLQLNPIYSCFNSAKVKYPDQGNCMGNIIHHRIRKRIKIVNSVIYWYSWCCGKIIILHAFGFVKKKTYTQSSYPLLLNRYIEEYW